MPVVRLDHANASDSEWHEVNLDNAVADADLDEALSTGAASSLPPRTPGALGYGGLIDGEWRTYPAEVFGPIPDMATVSRQIEAQRGTIP